MALRLTEHPGTQKHPATGEDLPLYPRLCAIEWQEAEEAPWRRVAYASKESGKPINFILRSLSDAQRDEIVKWFVETTGWQPNKVCATRMVDQPKPIAAPLEYTPEENAGDDAALDVDGVPDAEGVNDGE